MTLISSCHVAVFEKPARIVERISAKNRTHRAFHEAKELAMAISLANV